MRSRVRVPQYPVSFGGWTGTLVVDGCVLRISGDDPAHRLDIDCTQVKRWTFNHLNGLWALRMQDGRKLYLQTAGLLMSADRSPEGRSLPGAIRRLLRECKARESG